MHNYLIQIGYKDTDGRIERDSQVFEAQTKDGSLEKAKAFFRAKYSFCDDNEMIFSTPHKMLDSNNTHIAKGNRSVSIGGSSGTTVVTGDGNVVVRSGKYNIITTPSLNDIHIGDIYH